MVFKRYNQNYDTLNDGQVSQWNEGTLKSLRLHEAQEMINIAKISPLSLNLVGCWNYKMWIAGIDVLYGEGQSKYSTDEKKDIDSIKQIIVFKQVSKPVTSNINSTQFFGSKNSVKINYENWENLRRLIELFEQKVKLFNDKHGLSTRNYDEDDEGL